MDAITVVYAFAALCTKHFFCDFPLQVRYQYMNKGTYGHPGGLLHAGIHSVGTIVALIVVVQPLYLVALLALADGIIHYHIDWAKMNLNKRYQLTPTNSELFWYLLGLDQFLHYMTYIGIILVWYHIVFSVM